MENTVNARTEALSINPEIVKLADGLQAKTISIQTVVDNTGASFSFVQKMIELPIPRAVYDPDVVNVFGVCKVLEHKKIELSTFSMAEWKLPEPKVLKSSIDFQVGQFYVLPKSEGKQNVNCVYVVAYSADGYVLFVPVKNWAVDNAGMANKAPRVMGAGVACQLNPVQTDANGTELITAE